MAPWECDPPDAPTWLLRAVAPPPERIWSSTSTNAAAMPEGRRRRYAEAALRRSVEQVATAAQGQRNDTLNRACFGLARFIGTGDLAPAEVADALATAARHAAMPFPEVRATLASALRARRVAPLVHLTPTQSRPKPSPAQAPRPIRSDRCTALWPRRPFPIHALAGLRDAAEAIQLRTQAPVAICAQSALAAATLAVQAHRDVELPGGGRRPLTGIFASVAESGERKTSVDRIALAPVYKVEESWRQDNEAARAGFMNDLDAWKAARDKAKKANKGNRASIREALDAIGAEPKAPPQPMVLVSDPTPESLVLHLRDFRPWCGVFTAEGGILIGGSAFNDESSHAHRSVVQHPMGWRGDPAQPRVDRQCVPARPAVFCSRNDAGRCCRQAFWRPHA